MSAEIVRNTKSRNYVPYSPPRCDKEHSAIVAVPNFGREDCTVEQQYKAQAGVLNTSLYGKGFCITMRQFRQLAAEISC